MSLSLLSRSSVVAFGLFVASVLFSGCVGSTGPAISKSRMGNLAIHVHTPEEIDPRRAEIYIDGLYIGDITPQKPVLYIKRGEHLVRVELPGFKPVEKQITVLGDPNHQVMNVFLEKE